jgi:hypothetical protein
VHWANSALSESFNVLSNFLHESIFIEVKAKKPPEICGLLAFGFARANAEEQRIKIKAATVTLRTIKNLDNRVYTMRILNSVSLKQNGNYFNVV